MSVESAKEWLVEQTKKHAKEKYGMDVEVEFGSCSPHPIFDLVGFTSARIKGRFLKGEATVTYNPVFVEKFHDKPDVLYATMAHELSHIGQVLIPSTTHEKEMKLKFQTEESEVIAKEKYGIDLNNPATMGLPEPDPRLTPLALKLYSWYEKHERRTLPQRDFV